MTEALPAWVANMLNRRVTVEQVLFDVAAGKRLPLTPDECRELALKLGIPGDTPQPVEEPTKPGPTRLEKAAAALAESVSSDVNGRLLGKTYSGGNGGLVSKDTLAIADEVRRALAEVQANG